MVRGRTGNQRGRISGTGRGREAGAARRGKPRTGMSRIRAILFDMDGVLVNARPWHFEALNEALLRHGYRPIAPEDHLRHYDGLPTRRKLALLAQSQPIPAAEFEAINATKQALTLEVARAKCAPVPALVETLVRLRADGFLMAVCSNSVRASVDLLLEQSALTPFFAFTLSSDDVTHPKPHPEIYSKAMQRLQLAPEACLIAEDNVNGIAAARASGAHVLEIGDCGEVRYDALLRKIGSLA